ncbi:MAG: NAD(P)/FAD-dependent oxidoreductase [Halioglobus sp.]
MTTEHFDVLIVGAGISGIGAGCHLQQKCPGKSFLILEGREALGGTWDLFRYPGIRSDSDMYTLGYTFKPWTHAKAIADAPHILDYLRETVTENNLEPHIRYQHRVLKARWSSEKARWVIEVEQPGETENTYISCNFLHMCSGYYNYAAGYTPEFSGTEKFTGNIVHPQQWPEDLDYQGKKVIIIGSGATAVTLLPSMAKTAGHVTMLQRSPSYVVSRPAEDGFANGLRKVLPARWAYFLARWENILAQLFVYRRFQKSPEHSKKLLLDRVRKELGPDYDIDTHFTPKYNPWDQRLCLVPDSDMFESIRNGSASVVTDRIDTFTEKGLLLSSGKELEADLVVTATGLNLQFLSDVEFSVDDKTIALNETLIYRGMMLSGVPNMALSMGYTNASWTLKCDLTCDYICRLLNHMEQHGLTRCVPANSDPTLETEPYMTLAAGYIERSQHLFPRQGLQEPWKLYQNYLKDIFMLRYRNLEDGVMEFSD